MNKGRFMLLFGIACIFLFASVVFSFCAGQYPVTVQEALASVANYFSVPLFTDISVSPEAEAVLWQIRMPRTFVAILVGAGLAVSGATLQALFGNPLADPGIIGVSAGASVGAILVISLGISGFFVLPSAAFCGAFIAVSVTLLLARHKGRIESTSLLLSGVVMGMFLAAVTSSILTAVEGQKMQQFIFWTIGALDYRTWDHVWIGLIPVGFSVCMLLVLAGQLNVLALGDVTARSVGMRVAQFRMAFLTLATLATAGSVAIAGNIGFVGLVIPHILRMWVGGDHRRLLPLATVVGAAFLLFADGIGRVLIEGRELRVGIITAFLGAPYFLYLLRHQR